MSEKIMSRTQIVQAIADKAALPSNHVEAVLREFEALIAGHLADKGEVRLPVSALSKRPSVPNARAAIPKPALR